MSPTPSFDPSPAWGQRMCVVGNRGANLGIGVLAAFSLSVSVWKKKNHPQISYETT